MWELKVYKGEELLSSVVPTLFAFDKLFCISVGVLPQLGELFTSQV